MRHKEKRSVEIELSNSSLKTTIDEEDYLLVSQYTWRAKKDKGINVAYVATSKKINSPHTIRLHRLVMNAQPGMDVHHKDCNPFNNRKSNLEEIPAELHRGHPKAHITEYEDDCPI